MPKEVKNVVFTPELKARLKAHADKWIANAMRTDPVDPARLTDAIKPISVCRTEAMIEDQLACAEKAIAMLERQLAQARSQLASVRGYTTIKMQRAIRAARANSRRKRP